MANIGNQDSHCWNGKLHISNFLLFEARMIHMVVDQNWRHQYELMLHIDPAYILNEFSLLTSEQSKIDMSILELIQFFIIKVGKSSRKVYYN